jgi:hypothetical protein
MTDRLIQKHSLQRSDGELTFDERGVVTAAGDFAATYITNGRWKGRAIPDHELEHIVTDAFPDGDWRTPPRSSGAQEQARQHTLDFMATVRDLEGVTSPSDETLASATGRHILDVRNLARLLADAGHLEIVEHGEHPNDPFADARLTAAGAAWLAEERPDAGTPSRGPEPPSERLVFFITPLGKEGSPQRVRSDQIMREVLQPALDDRNTKHPSGPPLRVIRSIESDAPGDVTTQIVQDIWRSAFVVVDLTGHNPNVMYELGLADAQAIPTIRLTSDLQQWSFDQVTMNAIEIPGSSETGAIRKAESKHAMERVSGQIDRVLAAGFQLHTAVTAAGFGREAYRKDHEAHGR